MLNKTLFYSQKIILFLTLICFLVIWGGTFLVAQNDFFASAMPLPARILLLLAAAFLMLLIYQMTVHHLNHCHERQLMIYSAALFILMAIIYIVIICSFRIVPINDCHSLMDQALSMAHSGEKPMHTDGIYTNYFSKYSNNYLLAILFLWIFRAAEAIGITDMYMPLILLNMLLLMVGAFLTWRIARRVWGLSAAVKVLLLSTFCPVYYLMVFWIYSNTLSVPFMMALIDLALGLYQSETFKQRCFLGVGFGILIVLAFYIRPTAVIPVIAMLVCIVCYKGKPFYCDTAKAGQHSVKRGLAVFLLGILAAGITYMSVTALNTSYFSTVSDGNYPITHWLMMGSHDNGRYNLQDDLYTYGFEGSEEKKNATLSRTWDNYQSLGPDGTLLLFARKTVTVWSDGYFDMGKRLEQNMRYSRLYAWLANEKDDLFRLYCQSYWLAIVLLVILSCIRQLLSRKISAFPFLLLLSMFGGIVFYFFWEAKQAYAIPFLPLVFLLAVDGNRQLTLGLCKLQNKKKVLTRRTSLYARRMLTVCTFLLISVYALFAFDLYYTLTTYTINHHDYSIKCDGGSWLKNLNLADNDTLTQTIYPNAAFNRILLKADVVDAENGEPNDCKYLLTLTDSDGNEVYQTTITAADVRLNHTLTLSTGEIPAAKTEGYRLTITKQAGQNGDIVLRTRKGICLDTYPGEFSINDSPQGTDLYMQVYREFHAPYCRPVLALVICFGGFLIAAGFFLLLRTQCCYWILSCSADSGNKTSQHRQNNANSDKQ